MPTRSWSARHVRWGLHHRVPYLRGPALVHVTYVFGPRLPPPGRCITTRNEMDRLSRRT